jgi:ATP-dependent RNA helicase DeaD
MDFEKLVTNSNILRAIQDMGYETPTEIQIKSITCIREGGDMIGQSQTGTGKTAAFAIPVLEKINTENREPQVLILCPTRELSVQVAGEFRKISKYMSGIKTVPVYGGEPIYKQITELKRGAQVIVGTPGRLIDHINRRTIKFNNLHTIIMDEADEMLKMGFKEDIELILSSVDTEPQKIMFSATMPKPILDITRKYLVEPTNIKIQATGLTTSTVIQQYCAIKSKYKNEALFRLLSAKAPERCIVFCNTKKMVDDITDALQEKGFWSEKIHGDLKQELRMSVLHKFNAGVLNILVATDVAARGLDIQNVDLVVNYDVPEKEDYYVHRIGRSGRAGKAGESITLASASDRIRLHAIEHYIKKKIDKISVPSVQEVNDRKMENFIDTLMESMDQDVLDHYEPIIHKIEAKGYSVELLAAALLKDALTLHEMVEEQDINDHNFNKTREREYGTGRNDRDRSRDDRGRGDRSDRGERPAFVRKADDGTKEKRIFKDRDSAARSSKSQTRLFFSVGKSHNAEVRDLLGAITGECQVDGRSIGAIDMYDKFSFVDVEDQYVKQIITNLKDKRIKGRKVNVEVAKS